MCTTRIAVSIARFCRRIGRRARQIAGNGPPISGDRDRIARNWSGSMAIGIPIIGSRDPIARIGDRRPPFLRLISALGSAGEVSRRQDVAVRGFAMAMIDCPDAESRMGGNAAAVT